MIDYYQYTAYKEILINNYLFLLKVNSFIVPSGLISL